MSSSVAYRKKILAEIESSKLTKVDLIVVGAVIAEKQRKLINEAVSSIEGNYEFRNKFILMDGLKDEATNEDWVNYETYVHNVKRENPSFIVETMNSCIYFKEILKKHLKNSDADYIAVIQDDVSASGTMNITEDLSFMKQKSDCQLISYPHKVISGNGTNWFRPIENNGKFMKVHGWTERVFLANRERFYENISTEYVRGRNAKQFCEYAYHNCMKRSAGGRPSDEYWSKWGCYLKNGDVHTHSVGKRK